MKKPAFVPELSAVAREALIVMGGALIAAFVIGNTPSVREWIKAQWAGAKPLGFTDKP